MDTCYNFCALITATCTVNDGIIANVSASPGGKHTRDGSRKDGGERQRCGKERRTWWYKAKARRWPFVRADQILDKFLISA